MLSTDRRRSKFEKKLLGYPTAVLQRRESYSLFFGPPSPCCLDGAEDKLWEELVDLLKVLGSVVPRVTPGDERIWKGRRAEGVFGGGAGGVVHSPFWESAKLVLFLQSRLDALTINMTQIQMECSSSIRSGVYSTLLSPSWCPSPPSLSPKVAGVPVSLLGVTCPNPS